jgi:hypothetical protein
MNGFLALNRMGDEIDNYHGGLWGLLRMQRLSNAAFNFVCSLELN